MKTVNGYLYEGVTHTDTSEGYMRSIGMSDEVIESVLSQVERENGKRAERAIQTRFNAVYAPLETTHGLIDVGRGKDGILGMDSIKDAVAAHSSGLTEVESVSWIMSDNSVVTLTIADLNQIIVNFNLRKQAIFTAYSEWRSGDKQKEFTL